MSSSAMVAMNSLGVLRNLDIAVVYANIEVYVDIKVILGTSNQKLAPGTTPIRENEYDNGGSSIPGPSHAHHTPTDTLTSDEIMAMIMSFSDAAPNATSAPHLHTLEAGNDVHARLSTVRFDSPPPLRQVDSPPPSRSHYTPYKIIDRVAIHRGRHHLGDDVEQCDAGPSVPVPDTVPPPAVSLATTSEALPPTRAWFGLETIPEVKQKAREDMGRSMFDDSFLISSQGQISECT
ncbi:hypothetical protein EDD22DRAFT_960573 [Suillus occidentalis]|nr:hypothetical protein EDD22DRAFT_960573 [Suillus occidentalis]